jgi:hypothetical protein
VVFFNLLLRGDVRGADMLTVSRVAMLPKKDSGVRPIAIGDALLRALGATVVGAVREAAAAALTPHQSAQACINSMRRSNRSRSSTRCRIRSIPRIRRC